MIARLVWYGFLALIGVCTAALQLDRQSATMPAIASLTPEPVRSFAQAQIVAQKLQNGDPARALDEAKILVNRRPIPAETLRLLAQAQFAANAQTDGFVTIQIAARRGWRDTVAQESMLRLAVAAGDEAEAAKRYVALLLKNETSNALLQEIGAELFADAESPASTTLAQIVTDANRWRTTFVRRGARVLPPATFAKVIAASMDAGTSFDCQTLSRSAAVIANRDSEAASRLKGLIQSSC
ncbi:hypothetical protein [Erythrobacter sp. MTPC3]|uniref:hypothetical protein n=1 Tax=Erythrobacter sp. MTPC3 TaxID=3056564 RepID=UPI0036F43397